MAEQWLRETDGPSRVAISPREAGRFAGILRVRHRFSTLRARSSGLKWGKLTGDGVGGVFWLSKSYGRQTGRVG